MKSKIIFTVSLFILGLAGCKKATMNPDGINIDKAIDSGVLFSTWIINDDDTKKEQLTENSNYFKNKEKPELTLDKKGTYVLNYTSSGIKISEKGTWTKESSTNKLILKYNGTESVFVINIVNEEDFVITNIYTDIKNVTNAEGVVTAQSQTVKEILYLEDND
ncbi:MAG: hypothetical protein H0W61_14045 [Bacteroidetes bacterium]|nr:hypothetical protein [Bacteroidota bacterium]